MALKDNQGNLCEDVEQLFAHAQAVNFVGIKHDFHQTIDKGHGRIEIRRCWTMEQTEFLLVSRIFRAGSKIKNRALLYKGFGKPKSGARINKDTNKKPEEKEVHANHVEAFNSAIRRSLAAFRRRRNTYAKSVSGLQRVLDIFWLFHNFIRCHFTTRKVPAVAIGILEKGLT